VVNPASVVSTTATTATLSVLGADDGGEANLSYTWSVVAAPAGALPPTFSVNGSNAARSTTATFAQPGTYTLLASIQDAAGLTATSSVTITVPGLDLALNRPALASSTENGGTPASSGLRRQHRHALVESVQRRPVAPDRPRHQLQHQPRKIELGERLRQGLPDPGVQ